MANWAMVCELAADLPGTEQDPPGRMRALRVAGKLLAFMPRNERSQPEQFGSDEVLCVRTEYPTRAALIGEDPDRYAVTPHYEAYPGVLVRLGAVSRDELRELLTDGWRIVAPKRLVKAHLDA
jgi:hypothetical protein